MSGLVQTLLPLAILAAILAYLASRFQSAVSSGLARVWCAVKLRPGDSECQARAKSGVGGVMRAGAMVVAGAAGALGLRRLLGGRGGGGGGTVVVLQGGEDARPREGMREGADGAASSAVSGTRQIAKIALFFAIRPQSQRSGRGERAFPRPPLPRTRPQTAPLAANSAGSWAPGREGSGFSEGFFDPATRPRRSRPARQSSLSGNVASGSSMYTRANSAQGRARRKHVAPEDDDPDDPVLVFRQRADDSIPSEEPGSDAYTNTTETDPDRVEGAGGEAELSIAPDTMRRVTQRSHEDVFDEIVHPPRPGDTPEDLDRWRLFSLANLARDIYKGGVPANEASKLIGDRRRLDRMSEWHPDYNKLSRSVKRQEAKLRSQSGEGPSNVEILDHDEIPDLPEHIRRMLTDPTTRDLMRATEAGADAQRSLGGGYPANHRGQDA
eukprot:jgi/Mesvir1/13289/Mv02223-RA.1